MPGDNERIDFLCGGKPLSVTLVVAERHPLDGSATALIWRAFTVDNSLRYLCYIKCLMCVKPRTYFERAVNSGTRGHPYLKLTREGKVRELDTPGGLL